MPKFILIYPMKELFTFFLLIQLSVAFCQTTLSGKIKLSEKFDSKFYILKLNQIDPHAPIVYDSILIDSGGYFSYTFNNSNPQDLLYKIFIPLRKGNRFHTFDTVEKNFIFLTIEGNEKIELTADADSLYYSTKIIHPGINKNLLAYRDIRTPIYNLEKVYSDSIKLHPEREMEYKRRVMPIWMAHIEKAKLKYTQMLDTAQNTSMILMGILNLFESNFGKLDSASTYKYLSRTKNHDLLAVRNIKTLTSRRKSNRVGVVLPDITFQSTSGKKKQLHDIKSDFIVIDFWASWCSPCRYANKNELPGIYSRYKSKIYLIGLSIDEDESKWKKAVEKDNTPWEQYIDKQYVLKKLLDTYGVPVYVVLDKTFKVVYETMSTYQLEMYLDRTLKKSL